MDLSGVKPGDVIQYIGAGSWNMARHLTEVVRTTKTLVICKNDRRFHKKNGRIIGGGHATKIMSEKDMRIHSLNGQISTEVFTLKKLLEAPTDTIRKRMQDITKQVDKVTELEKELANVNV